MRRAKLSVVVMVAVCGLSIWACDNTVITPNNSKGDLAGFVQGGGDLARPTTYDLALPPGQMYGCKGLVNCYNACAATSTTQTEYQVCQNGCDAKSQSDASTKYDAALACGQTWCLNMSSTSSSAPSYKCMLDASMTRLVNLDGTDVDAADPGTGQKACGACLDEATAILFGTTCDQSNADCEPSSCISVTATCLSDTP